MNTYTGCYRGRVRSDAARLKQCFVGTYSNCQMSLTMHFPSATKPKRFHIDLVARFPPLTSSYILTVNLSGYLDDASLKMDIDG